MCSNRLMDVQLPDWWTYPKCCGRGHGWGPGRVIVSWLVYAARERQLMMLVTWLWLTPYLAASSWCVIRGSAPAMPAA